MENIDKRINLLIKQGYTQAAFDNRVNAEKFARKWKEKGYKIIGFLSSGPSVENPKKRSIHAYYVIADKPKLPRINLKSHVNTPSAE